MSVFVIDASVAIKWVVDERVLRQKVQSAGLPIKLVLLRDLDP